jgi:signal transduction histidine kinase
VVMLHEDIIGAFAGIAGILFASRFLNTRKNSPFYHRVFLGLLGVYVAAVVIILSGSFQTGIVILEINSLLLVFSFFLAAYQTMRNGYKPAKFFLIAWSFLLLSVIVFILDNFNLISSSTFASHSIQIGSAVEALLLSMALANRINVYKEEIRNAEQATLLSLEKNRKLVVEQNIMLERKVAERTDALKKTNDELVMAMQNLKETQAQLVQREKMASLGELTAGIAHEIQNPLNFVNNFSEVSSELLDELKTELDAGSTATAAGIAADLKEILERVLIHSKRADSIVRGMLEHSRLHNGQCEEASVNDIIDEALRLSYHAVRANDKNFTAILETHFDENIGKMEVVAEDIGRVLLNIFNNAFYSLRQKKKKGLDGYQPVLSVFTRKENRTAFISIRDNGMGIPQKVMAKIYQPFFTTKPAGEGTGLGLSLSYDIITKEHGGSLQVDTKEGEYAEFMIQLPIKTQAVER